MSSRRMINFGAGPAKIPEKVMLRAQAEMLDYNDTGISIMETSHRTAAFKRVLCKAEQDLRDLVNIPDNYEVLFLQGGAVGQFSAIPMNIIRDGSADYMVTGYWSAKAAKEAEKHGKVNHVFPESDGHKGIPPKETWMMNSKASYLYFCDNETIQGIEFSAIPETKGIPVVCDMSSNFLSRPLDITKFGIVFAGSHKNMGCPGVTVVIIRNDLIGHASSYCPSVLNYKKQVAENSCYNTPPTYSIYICGLVLKWTKENGGLEKMQELSKMKASIIYDVIDQSDGFYCSRIGKEFRSKINIPFTIGGPDGVELQKKFTDEALELDMISLEGHSSVGGLRASLYNAITVEETKKLADFMSDFQDRNQ